MKSTIGNHMVKSPFMGRPDQGLNESLEMMKRCGIRHLPISDGARLIGLVSERDVREALALPQTPPLRIGDVMKTELFVVKRNSNLRDVVAWMKEEKIGSALVVNDAMECIGIFTTIDALAILADLLDDRDEESNVLHFADYIEHWRVPANTLV